MRYYTQNTVNWLFFKPCSTQTTNLPKNLVKNIAELTAHPKLIRLKNLFGSQFYIISYTLIALKSIKLFIS